MEPFKANQGNKPGKTNLLAGFLKAISRKVSCYFEPEEVEVTFEEGDKKQGSYTYTVLPNHKPAA